MRPPSIGGWTPTTEVWRRLLLGPTVLLDPVCLEGIDQPMRIFQRPPQRSPLLRPTPRRKAVALVGAAITIAASFLVVQGGIGNADVVSGPPSKLLAVGPTSPDNGFPVWYKD